MAIVYYDQKDYKQSLSILKIANAVLQESQLSEESLRAEIFYYMACCCIEMKEYTDAIASLQQALTRINRSSIFFALLFVYLFFFLVWSWIRFDLALNLFWFWVYYLLICLFIYLFFWICFDLGFDLFCWVFCLIVLIFSAFFGFFRLFSAFFGFFRRILKNFNFHFFFPAQNFY